jgi:hypothetical protein
MKAQMIILALALSGASQVIALDQPATPFTSSTVVNGNKTVHWINPLTQPPVKNNHQPRYLGGMSTRPWGAGTGWHPAQSVFADERTHEAHFNLVWFGAEPPE